MTPHVSLPPMEANQREGDQYASTDEAIVQYLLPKMLPYIQGKVLALDEPSHRIVARGQVDGTNNEEHLINIDGPELIDLQTHMVGQFDSIVAILGLEKDGFKSILENLAMLLKPGGYLVAVTPASIGLYREMEQGAMDWAAQNIEKVRLKLRPHFRLKIGRCLLIRTAQLANGSIADQEIITRIARIPVFAFREKLSLLPGGTFVWFAAQKREPFLTK